MIVTGHGEKSAFGCRAFEITQLERLAGPIDTHSLPVPQTKHTLEAGAAEPL